MAISRVFGALIACASLVAGAEEARRVLTVAVDGRTGKLVRVPVTRQTREVASRTVTARQVEAIALPETPVAAQPERPAYRRPVASLTQLIDRIANQYWIRPSFVHAVIKAESGYDRWAVSSKGARGLMQLMPETARRFGVRNIFDPAENIEGGVRFLRHLLDLYPDPRLSLAAYNAGEGAVERYRAVPPYSETRQFVRRVNGFYQAFQQQAERERPAPPPKKLEGPRIYQVVDASGLVRITTSLE